MIYVLYFYKFNSHLNAQGYSTKIKFFTFFKTIYIYLRQIFRQKMDTYNMYAFDFCTSFDQLKSPGWKNGILFIQFDYSGEKLYWIKHFFSWVKSLRKCNKYLSSPSSLLYLLLLFSPIISPIKSWTCAFDRPLTVNYFVYNSN